MTIEQLRRAIRAEKFRPFTISLADRRRFRVRHPEFVSIGSEAIRTFVVAGASEDYSIIDLLLVTSFDFEDAKANRESRKGNGR